MTSYLYAIYFYKISILFSSDSIGLAFVIKDEYLHDMAVFNFLKPASWRAFGYFTDRDDCALLQVNKMIRSEAVKVAVGVLLVKMLGRERTFSMLLQQ